MSSDIQENKLTLVVLAAGMGSRYGGLKQLDPVGPNGETLLDYSVYDAIRAGFQELVFVLRRDMEDSFRERVAATFARQAAVEFVFQEIDRLPDGFAVPAARTKPWGTSHALLMASEVVHGPFAVINADDFYGAAAYRMLAQLLKDESQSELYAMVGFVLRNTLSSHGGVARGVCRVSEDGWLEEVVELTNIEQDGERARSTDAHELAKALSGNEVVSMNMWGFRPGIFSLVSKYFQEFLLQHGSELRAECYLPSAVNEFIAKGQACVKVLPSRDRWFGMTYREDHSRVVDSIWQLIQEDHYPERLWS